MQINLGNILSLTDFKKNASQLVEQVRQTHSPIVLTVNGKAEVVVHEAEAFQSMIDKIQQLEQELESIRQAELRQAIELGIAEAARGEVAPLDIEAIKQEGRQRRSKL
ncbi:MAG: type II toxin-antitoxin system Phd/YefM family antitoxin [Oculatellaceae cyanobacterium Prado106]|jgi:prevent-host-death family protein|nr:type II toxin-antitoxin system Phd/YefM family antitoxin [Oculatellaceae cyanobacterium Prado106]